jgi:hypothetical protein
MIESFKAVFRLKHKPLQGVFQGIISMRRASFLLQKTEMASLHKKRHKASPSRLGYEVMFFTQSG